MPSPSPMSGTKAGETHTPGPWASDGTDILDKFRGHIAYVDDLRPSVEEVSANVRLIRAAPNLLKALKAALSAANDLRISSVDFPRPEIEAAISLAEAGER